MAVLSLSETPIATGLLILEAERTSPSGKSLQTEFCKPILEARIGDRYLVWHSRVLRSGSRCGTLLAQQNSPGFVGS